MPSSRAPGTGTCLSYCVGASASQYSCVPELPPDFTHMGKGEGGTKPRRCSGLLRPHLGLESSPGESGRLRSPGFNQRFLKEAGEETVHVSKAGSTSHSRVKWGREALRAQFWVEVKVTGPGARPRLRGYGGDVCSNKTKLQLDLSFVSANLALKRIWLEEWIA